MQHKAYMLLQNAGLYVLSWIHTKTLANLMLSGKL